MLTREELLREIESRLDERLSVEEPPPYGRGILVDFDEATDTVLVVQPRGPHFVVRVDEGQA